jgi:hypothetical protein
LDALAQEKLIGPRMLRRLLAWKHSGFNLDAGERPVAAGHTEGLRSLAEYLLRAPFSLEKITWNQATRRVIYRSSRNWRTKRNFEVFAAGDFLAAAVEHIPPKGQQTIRYYGIYSNKHRGKCRTHEWAPPRTSPDTPGAGDPPAILPAPPPASARALRPLWRDLIRRTFGDDPLVCPCCKATMTVARPLLRREEIEFFLRLHGLWEGATGIPPPPDPPYDIDTMEPVPGAPPWLRAGDRAETDEPAWLAPELPLGDGRTLVLDGDAAPPRGTAFSV